MGNAAILLAGGSGSRMRGIVEDKVLAQLSGVPVILHSLRAFLDSASVAEVVFVCRDSVQEAAIKALIEKYFPKIGLSVKFARGGAERQDSVLNGLMEVSDESAIVFIHDGARPMITKKNVADLYEAAASDGAAVLASRVSDTIKRLPDSCKSARNCVLEDLDRGRLWAMQTPQVFVCSRIKAAYERVREGAIAVTDDVLRIVDVFNDDLMSVCVHLHGIALEHSGFEEQLGRHGKHNDFGFYLFILHTMFSFNIFS